MMIALYLRASTQKQEKGFDAQFKALEAYCREKGISKDEYSIYQDFAYSGSNCNRPGLSKLLADVHAGKITQVICYSFSRISRSIRDLIHIVDKLEDNNVKFLSLSESVDTSTPMGRCFLHIIASLNQAEREILSERTKNGLRAAVKRGVRLGAKKVYDDSLILKLSAQGLTGRQIANTVGCSPSNVSRILKRYSKDPLAKADLNDG